MYKTATTGRANRMPRTLGYHLVKTCYGRRLPGDERGSWSDAWDDMIGFYEPHMLHQADPVRSRMAQERMRHPVVWLNQELTDVIADALGACITRSDGGLSISAAAIDFTHMHLLLPFNPRNIDITAKWIADQTTKAVHRLSAHQGPIWAKGKWCAFIYNPVHWDNAMRYIEAHNERLGLTSRPYTWLS